MISALGLIWGLGITGITSGAAFGLLLWRFDPTSTGYLGLSLFFVSLAVFAICLCFFVLQLISRRGWDQSALLLRSLRQAIILGAGIIALLGLAYFDWLFWWSGVLLALVLLAIEVYFRVRLE